MMMDSISTLMKDLNRYKIADTKKKPNNATSAFADTCHFGDDSFRFCVIRLAQPLAWFFVPQTSLEFYEIFQIVGVEGTK